VTLKPGHIVIPDLLPKAEIARTVGTEYLKDVRLMLFTDGPSLTDHAEKSSRKRVRWTAQWLNVELLS